MLFEVLSLFKSCCKYKFCYSFFLKYFKVYLFEVSNLNFVLKMCFNSIYIHLEKTSFISFYLRKKVKKYRQINFNFTLK